MIKKVLLLKFVLCSFFLGTFTTTLKAQTLAFPGAKGFGRFAPGARGVASPQVYKVTNLNNSGAGSFRDAVSQPGRIIVFSVSGIINLTSDIVVAPNTTIAGQTAPGEGIVLFGKRVTFSSSSNTIARYIRIRLGATDNAGKDASGISNGANMIFDHMTFTWGMDEVFSINWDNKGTSPDNITIQNSIIAQGLHRNNHSAGGLMQPSDGKISLIGNLYSSNKTRNPKVKGINEFVNNVVYNWGNFGNPYGHTESGDAYIMGGDSEGTSNVNIINNYFIGGPLTSNATVSPFRRGNENFFLYGSGNYFDNNKNGTLDGNLVANDLTGYPTGDIASLQATPYDYPMKNPTLTAEQAFAKVIDSVGASYPKRDQVDSLIVAQLNTKGNEGIYLYRESDLPFGNGGVGNVFSAPAPLDTDSDGMPDAWEDAHSLDKNDAADAVTKTLNPDYLNIEIYINGLISVVPPVFIIPPSNITFTATSTELPTPSSSVVLHWNDNADNEDNFVIERSLNGTDFTLVTQVAANVKTYTEENLVPNTKYYYRIKATNSSESSSYSAVASVTTPPIPTAPTKAIISSPSNGFNFTELSSGNLTLKWTGSSNTTTYEVYFGTDAANLTKLGDVAYVAAPSYVVPGLIAGTNYFWRIDAINAKGTATGDVWTFRTITAVPQGMVGYFAFDETAIDGLKITDSTTYANDGVLALDDDDASIRVTGKVKGALDFATARTDIYVGSVPSQDQLFLDKNSFSISFWMKADASLLPLDATSSYLLCKGSITKNAATGATGKRFDIEFKSGQLRFAIDDDVNKRELSTSGTPFFTGDWVHVVAMRDISENKLKLYLNGALIKDFDATGVTGIGEASALVIGNIGELEFLANTNTPAPYKGQLDELKIFNYALSPAQVLEQFNVSPLPLKAYTPNPATNGTGDDAQKTNVSWTGGLNTTTYKLYLGTTSGALNYVADTNVGTATYQFTDLTANTQYFWRVDAVGAAGTTTGDEWTFTTAFAKGIVADWHLDATSGTTITDNSTYANNGSIDNVSAYEWTTEGKLNNALNLQTNTNGGITVAHQEQMKFDKSSFSISLWMKATAPPAANSVYLFHKGTFAANGSGATGKWFGVEFKTNRLYFSVDDNVNKTPVTIGDADVKFFTNDWVHLVFVRNVGDKTLKVYANGVEVGTAAENNSSILNGIGGTEPLIFANNFDLMAPFTGALDEVKIFNYALSPAEITTLSQAQTLPVNLTAFNATQDGNRVKINWSTLSEQHNDHFTMEKSIDGQSFSAMATIAGHGTTNEAVDYVTYDQTPVLGNNYYRLIQVDQDGASKNLGIKVVKFGLNVSVEEVLIYPNPLVQHIYIKVPVNVAKAKVSLSSLNGKQIFVKNLSAAQNQLMEVALETKPSPGIYLLEIKAEEFHKTAKVVVK